MPAYVVSWVVAERRLGEIIAVREGDMPEGRAFRLGEPVAVRPRDLPDDAEIPPGAKMTIFSLQDPAIVDEAFIGVAIESMGAKNHMWFRPDQVE